MQFFDGYLSLYKKPIFIIGYCLMLCACYLWWDQTVAIFFHQLNLSVFDYYLHLTTHLGLVKYYLIILGIPYLFYKFIIYNRQQARNILFILLSIIIPGVLCDILKLILSRARPEPFFDHHIYGFKFFETNAEYWSFPSGHSTVIFAFMLALSYLKPRYFPVFLLIGLIVAATRFILTAHYLSDVLASFFISTYIVMFIHNFMLNLDWYLQHSKQLFLKIIK